MKARAKRIATKEAKSNTSSYKKKNRIKGENKKPKHNRNYRDEY